MADYDVIVLGAGNGGLSSAAVMAKEGKKVLVLEKHNIPGGCGTSFRRGRFEFEVALHQLSSLGTPEKPGPLRELFADLGIEDQIEWIPIDSLFRVGFPDGSGVTLATDRRETEEILIKKFPDQKKAVLDYFDAVYHFSEELQQFYDSVSKSTGEPPVLKKLATQLLFRKKFPYLSKYALLSTQEAMDGFGMSNDLQLCLNAYWCFMGMPPERFPFSIQARCTYIYIEDKPYFLKGGSQVMSSALTEAIRKFGGDIKFSTPAAEMLLDGKGAACGVVTADGTKYTCRKIISNISPVHTYFNLLKPEDVPRAARDYLGAYTVGISALMCYIGLDCPPEEIGFTDSFNLLYDDTDANDCFRDAYKLMPRRDPIVATNYTVDSPKVCPEGTSLVTAGCLKYGESWVELPPEKYYETKWQAADMLVERLEKRYPGFRSHIEEIEIATPLTCMRYLSHPQGAVYGFEQDVKSSVFFFPTQSHIENLSFASGWSHACGFGPNYLNGNEVAQKVMKELT